MPRHATNWGVCSKCGREKELHTKRGEGRVLKQHNRWDGSKMIFCTGSDRQPISAAAARAVFRSA